MKKIILLTLMSLLFYGNSKAAIPIPYCDDCEYVKVVAELPDSGDYFSEEYNAYADIGYIYKQLWLVWLPIWNYGGRYCLYIKDQDIYFDFTYDEIKEIADLNNIKLPESPIPLWDKVGGKIIFGGLLLFGLYEYFRKKKKEDVEEEEK